MEQRKDEPSGKGFGGTHDWIAVAAGCVIVAAGLVAIFVVSGHDASISTALVTGVGLLFGGLVLPRLTGEFEIGPSGLKGRLEALRKVVTKAEETLASDENSAALLEPRASGTSVIDAAVREASHSPVAALVLLSRAIEHELRLLLEQTGWVPSNERMGVMQMITAAERRHAVSASLTSSVRVFGTSAIELSMRLDPCPSTRS
jgi:hypothetical protein